MAISSSTNVRVSISEDAQEYLRDLLGNQGGDIGVRFRVTNPGTADAETRIDLCRDGEENEDDEVEFYKSFCAYYDKASLPYLSGTRIDYIEDNGTGELSVQAPNAKNPDAPTQDCAAAVGYWEPT